MIYNKLYDIIKYKLGKSLNILKSEKDRFSLSEFNLSNQSTAQFESMMEHLPDELQHIIKNFVL